MVYRSLLALAVGFMSSCVYSANIYVDGSTPARMHTVVMPVLGDAITPIFFLGNDGQRFMADIDAKAARDFELNQITLTQYLNALQPNSRSHGVIGYTMGGAKFHGNEIEERTCAIVLADELAMRTTSTMFHEAIHCRTFADLRKDRNAFSLAVSFNKPALGMTTMQYISFYHEALAAFLQVAYASNNGRKDGLSMVLRSAKATENKAVSIGYRTARAALEMCGKPGACPTATADLVRMLSKDSLVMNRITADIVELQMAAVKSGYVLADQ